MRTNKYLVDTNILIYHTQGLKKAGDFINSLTARNAFNISILTKIEFLGWDKHTQENFESCAKLIELANVYTLDDDIADKAVEIRRKFRIKLADSVIAATAIVHDLKLATRNIDDFKEIPGLEVDNIIG